MKLWWITLSCALLCACASTAPPPPEPESLFIDAQFAPPSVPVSAGAVFTLSPRMREVFNAEFKPRMRGGDPRRALVVALYDHGTLRLDYDAEMTRTAAEAFDARAGNCLSLLIMTAAFAREAGLPVRFQSVLTADAWSRSGGLLFAMGHVNLALGRNMLRSPGDADGPEWLMIDFVPAADLRRQHHEVIDEARVLAMYMNNKAAEALAAGHVDDAYAWARAAILQDRRFTGGYNTLGVVYQQRGEWPAAERALRAVLAMEPAHLHAMSNLVGVLKEQGRDAEAQVLAAELHRLQPTAPFAAFNDGLQRMREGRYAEAKALFERELGRTAGYHEVYFWLAVACLNLGDSEGAQRNLKLAQGNSSTREQQALYAGKLERLKAQGVH